MNRTEKLEIMRRLRNVGLWDEAEKYREEIRQQLRTEGKSRREAVAAAWQKMADEYLPLAEEAEQKPKLETILGPGAECYDDIVATDYRETNLGIQIRDAYIWLEREFYRIVRDGPKRVTVDFTRAKTPPPTVYACGLVDAYARESPKGRIDLHNKLMQVLCKSGAASHCRRGGSR